MNGTHSYIISFNIFLFLLSSNLLQSQSLKRETLGLNGLSQFVYTHNSSYFIQQSIGQGSVINTFNTSQHSLRQGFLQPISGTALNLGENTTLNASIFPNPFSTQVTVQFNEPLSGELYVMLFDITGKLVYERIWAPNPELVLGFGDLSSGYYMLYIKMHRQTLKAKLIKP